MRESAPEMLREISDGLTFIQTNPLGRETAHGVIRHLKGKILCNREFRRLPNGWRIIYRTPERDEDVITVTYIGQHPRERDYQRYA